jgi:hypothetical protein
VRVLAITLLIGCTNVDLDLIADSSSNYDVGEGLDAVFWAWSRTCEPGDQREACEMQQAPISSLELRGDLALISRQDHELRVHGGVAGPAIAEVEAGGLFEAMPMNVLPIAYTRISRRGEDFDWRILDSDPLPAFQDAAFELFQEHYREPREMLEQTSWTDHIPMRLNGYAELALFPGETTATLVPIEDDPVLKRHPRHDLAVGPVLGIAKLTTTVGGSLAVEVVDETAIASIEIGERDLLDSRYNYPQPLFVSARAASGRGIVGCPKVGPKITDTAGILTVTPAKTCGFMLELTEGRDWVPTTIVVEWNGIITEVAITP